MNMSMILKELAFFNAQSDGFLIIVLVDVSPIVLALLTTLLIGKVELVWLCAHKLIQQNITQIILLVHVLLIAQLLIMVLIEIQFFVFVCLYVQAYNMQITQLEIALKNAQMTLIYMVS